MRVHNELGPGLREKPCENALAVELREHRPFAETICRKDRVKRFRGKTRTRERSGLRDRGATQPRGILADPDPRFERSEQIFTPKKSPFSAKIFGKGSRIDFSQQPFFPIYYHGKVVGECIPDCSVGGEALVDAKSVDGIGQNERAQMRNYLVISGCRLGLVVNFRNARVEWDRLVR